VLLTEYLSGYQNRNHEKLPTGPKFKFYCLAEILKNLLHLIAKITQALVH